jgi:GAF domain-containing protein
MPIDEAMAFVKKRAGIQFDPQVVQLLEERYLELEELARQQIEEVEPLKTDLFIERGAAPGAGFAPEKSEEPQSLAASQSHLDALSQIAEATRESRAVFELSRLLGNSLSADALCTMIGERLQTLVPFDCLAVYRKREESVAALYLGGPLAKAFSDRPIPLGEGLSGWVADSERPIVNGNPTVETNFETGCESITEDSSALAIPLFDLNGVAFGVLTLYSRQHAAFSKDHLRVLQAVESNFALALQNALQFEAEQRAVHASDLREFLEAVDAEAADARKTGKRFGVAVCDIYMLEAAGETDAAKRLNTVVEELQHEFCRIAILRTCVEEGAILFCPSPDASLESLNAGFELAAQRAGMHAHHAPDSDIGIALYPQDAESAEQLLGAANRRMRRRAQELRTERRDLRAQHALEGALSL